MDNIKEIKLPENLPEEFSEFHFSILRKSILEKKPGIHVLSDELGNVERQEQLFRFIQKTVQEKMNEKGTSRKEKHYILFIIDNEKYNNIDMVDRRVIPIKLSTMETSEITTTALFLDTLSKNRNNVLSSCASYLRRTMITKKDLGVIIFYPTLMAQIARANFANHDPKFVAYKEAEHIFRNWVIISIEDNKFFKKKK